MEEGVVLVELSNDRKRYLLPWKKILIHSFVKLPLTWVPIGGLVDFLVYLIEGYKGVKLMPVFFVYAVSMLVFASIILTLIKCIRVELKMQKEFVESRE